MEFELFESKNIGGETNLFEASANLKIYPWV